MGLHSSDAIVLWRSQIVLESAHRKLAPEIAVEHLHCHAATVRNAIHAFNAHGVVFNKHNAKFIELLDKVPQAIRTHPHCVQEIPGQASGEWRYMFSSEEDDLRRIMIHAFIFDIYTRK